MGFLAGPAQDLVLPARDQVELGHQRGCQPLRIGKVAAQKLMHAGLFFGGGGHAESSNYAIQLIAR